MHFPIYKSGPASCSKSYLLLNSVFFGQKQTQCSMARCTLQMPENSTSSHNPCSIGKEVTTAAAHLQRRSWTEKFILGIHMLGPIIHFGCLSMQVLSGTPLRTTARLFRTTRPCYGRKRIRYCKPLVSGAGWEVDRQAAGYMSLTDTL